MLSTREQDSFLAIRQVTKSYPVRGGLFNRETARVRVLNCIDLTISKGEIFGLVGESGCGKSTLAKLLVKLIEPTSGDIVFNNLPLAGIRGNSLKSFYRQVQMIFQDPFSSLNPRHKVKDIIGEMVRVHGAGRHQEQQQVQQILAEVGLPHEPIMDKYPHEFSGGQRQRLAIARALILHPRLLVADEPVSALDLAIQRQILILLANLHKKYDLTILFISHDLNTVQNFCDRLAVMYLGRIVELLPAARLFSHGCHPYLKGLIASLPVKHPSLRQQEKDIIPGEPPSPLQLPSGCFFHPRCRMKMDICRTTTPPPTSITASHTVCCHLYGGYPGREEITQEAQPDQRPN